MEKKASSRQKKQSLVLILSLVITGAVAFLIIIQNIITITNTKKSLSTDNIHQCENITRLYGEKIEQKIDELNSALGIYTNDESIQTKNTSLIVESLKRNRASRNKNFEYVAYVDAEGNFTSDEGNTANVVSRDYFHAIMKEGKDFVVDIPVSSMNTGKNIVHICRAAKVNGKTIGFFTGIILVDSFNEMLRDAKIGQSGFSIMIAEDGSYMASSIDSDSAKKVIEVNSSRDFRSELADLKPGVAQSIWLENSTGRYLSTHYIIRESPWIILMFVNRREVFTLVQQNVVIILYSSIFMLAILALLIFMDCNYYLKPLKDVESSINTISRGNADLTQRIRIKSKKETEITRLVRGFNHFVEKLQTIMIVTKDSKSSLEETSNTLNLSIENSASSITQISNSISNMDGVIQEQTQSVNSTAGAVNQITANIGSLYKMIENQSAGINEASAAVEQMITNIRSVNNSMTKMDGEFTRLKQKSEEGVKKQKAVNENIKIIENDSKSLREANAVISSIAHQTNLLAMNAAIEAAHAGELGKGFSVVADEIRKLSETSSQQSKSIGEQLRNISENITNIVSTSQDAGTYLIDVAEGIHDTSGLVRQITNAMDEQEEGSRQIIVALQIMNNSTSEVKTSSEEMTEGSNIILQAVEHLQNNTFTLKENMSEISKGAKTINNLSQELNNLSGKVNDSVTNIGSQVDKFIV